MDKTGKRTVYVGGIDKQVTDQVLYAAFVPFGPIKGVQVPMDYATQSNKGFGFVEFEYAADAQAALDNMDEAELFGRTLRVNIAKPDKPKLGSRKPVWAESDSAKDTTTASDEPQTEAAATSHET